MLKQIRILEKKRIRESPDRCILPCMGYLSAEKKRVLVGKYWKTRTGYSQSFHYAGVFTTRKNMILIGVRVYSMPDPFHNWQDYSHTNWYMCIQWYMVATLGGFITRSNGHEFNYFIQFDLQSITTIQIMCLSWDVGKLDATKNTYNGSSNIVMPVI